jgi:hypothetical protein
MATWVLGRGWAIGVAVVVAMVLGARAWPTQARACTYAPVATAGQPAASAANVPVDVVPWFRAFAINQSELHVRLIGPGEEEVPVDPTFTGGGSLDTYVEVWPTAPLEAETDYHLVVEMVGSPHGEDVELLDVPFRTGSHVASVEPEPPLASMELLEFTTFWGAACHDSHTGCIGAEGSAGLELQVRDEEDGTVISRQLGVETVQYMYRDYAADRPFCIELRKRSLAGVRSEPAALCSADVPMHLVDPGDVGLPPITCHAGALEGLPEPEPEPNSSKGCAVTAPAVPRPPAWVLLILLPLLRLVSRGRSGISVK